MTTPRYGVLEGKPVRFTDDRAYWYIDRGWRSIDAAEVAMNAKELQPAEFARRFPMLHMPITLFQEAGSVT